MSRWRRTAGPNRSHAPDVSPTVITVATSPMPDRAATADASFDALFRAHYDRLVRMLTAVAGDRDAAADAVQEAFVRAHVRWRRVGRYDDPIGWVRRVAINRLRDDHRRTGRRDRAVTRLAATSPASAATPAPDRVEEIDATDRLERLLAGLPRQQRLTTAMFYVDGLTVAEIAVALGIAEGSVKSHLHDARRRLRDVLALERDDARGRTGGGS